MSRKLTDEKICETLLRTGSIRDAAIELHCTPKTIYDRLHTPELSAMYNQARDNAVKAASERLTASMMQAIDTITGIMQSEDAAPQTKLNASQLILTYGLKFVEVSNIMQRLEALEAAQPERIVQS